LLLLISDVSGGEVELMKHGQMLNRTWMLPVLIAILIAAHAMVFYRAISHTTVTIALGLILLMLLKHVGVFGPIYAFLRRRSRP
jgi:hypothetical protein